MKLATLCSGIGAPEVAAKRLGWECLWSAEVDPQASAVLAHHHPESVNLGDITKIDGRELERPDVLVFGTPCQSFSVAGRRAGMDDPRGVLAFVALGIVGRVRPTWFVLENVPGLLSSSAGRDFGAFLRAVDDLGYSGAWASPDAQFFGLAQRRERVFFVGHIGDWRYPTAVLSQFSRLCGHPAPSREAREGVAGTLKGGSGERGWPDPSDGNGGGLIAHSLRAKANMAHREDADTLITHSLCVEGFDASEDGTGRGIPLVMAHGQTDATIMEDSCPSLTCNHEAPIVFSCKDSGCDVGEISPTLRAMGGKDPNGGGQVAMAAYIHPRILRNSESSNQVGIKDGRRSDALTSEGPGAVALAFQSSQSGVRLKDTHATLDSNNGSRRHHGVMQYMSVRRLTPRECERLQGFEDDYTLIPYGKKGKPMADGPRYKMIGNSMAVPVVEWILARIDILAKA